MITLPIFLSIEEVVIRWYSRMLRSTGLL